jgi:HPt (histidine-containing phosphotransfer) domain-containing protein
MSVFADIGLPRPELREEVARLMAAQDFSGMMELIEKLEWEASCAGMETMKAEIQHIEKKATAWADRFYTKVAFPKGKV